MARLNGSPFTSMEGDRKTSRKNPERPVNVLLKEVMRNVPVTMVVRHVKTNNTTFSQGNFCCGASSSSISAEGLNVLSMKEVFLFSAGSSANARLPRLDGKYTKAAQLDPVVGLQGILHAIKDRIHSLFSFCFADSCPLDDLIHKIEFDHWNLRF